MNVHKNARLTPLGRERMVRQMEGQTPQAVAEPQASPADGAKWLARFTGRRPGRPGRSLLATAAPVPADAAGCRADRRAAPPALDRQADRRRRSASRRLPSAASCALGLSRISGPRARRAGASLRARAPGELIHFDIKKLGRFDRVGHRITGDRSGSNRARGKASAGSSSMSASTTPRASPSPRS